MTERIIVKEQLCLMDEFNETSLCVNFMIKIVNTDQYILEIFDDNGRHFQSHEIDIIGDPENLKLKYTPTTVSANSNYNQEYNFEKRRSDVWIDMWIDGIHILNEEFDETSLDFIENKIKYLQDELEVLLKKQHDLKKQKYPYIEDRIMQQLDLKN